MNEHVYNVINEQLCDPCKSCKNEDNGAVGFCKDCNEYLCTTCFNGHLMVRVARNHVLLEIADLPHEEAAGHDYSQLGTCDERSIECKIHPNNDIQLFCEYHSALCCYICTTITHTEKLCKVQYIPHIAKRITENGQLSQVQQNLQSVIRRTKDANENVKSLLDLNEKQRETGHDTAKQFARKIRAELKNREDDLEKQIQSRYEINQRKFSPTLEKYQSAIEDAENRVDSLDKNQGSENSITLFLAYFEAKAKIEEIEEVLVKTKVEKKLDECNITCDLQLIKLIEDPTSVAYENVDKQQPKQSTKGRAKRTTFQPGVVNLPARRERNSSYFTPVSTIRDRINPRATSFR